MIVLKKLNNILNSHQKESPLNSTVISVPYRRLYFEWDFQPEQVQPSIINFDLMEGKHLPFVSKQQHLNT
jgi:ribosome-associated toxin RatA of RatAB toxin-antitoxin module